MHMRGRSSRWQKNVDNTVLQRSFSAVLAKLYIYVSCIFHEKCLPVVTLVAPCDSYQSSDSGISLFCIPASVSQHRAWTAAIARKNCEPKSWERVCGKHFVSGWLSGDLDDVDFQAVLLMKAETRVQWQCTSQISTSIKED